MNAPPTDRRAERGVVEFHQLTKSFGSFRAVDDLTFTVEPGRVTGFLGPNGAGKTTSLRMLLGLIRPTSGHATIGGSKYVDLADPLHVVGAALEATNFHPGRTGRDHLRVAASAAGIPDSRADELLELVGIQGAARKRAGNYSMGMRQRLGLAAALLGDPDVIILDEPANGLDPEGIRWLRGFLRALAAEGKTVLISSHMLGEVEHIVDDIVILSNGRLVKKGTLAELRGAPSVIVRSPETARLREALEHQQFATKVGGSPDELVVSTERADAVGDIAFRAGVPVHELTPHRVDLEAMFFELTSREANRNLGQQAPAQEGAK